jgi:hypothetical protein
METLKYVLHVSLLNTTIQILSTQNPIWCMEYVVLEGRHIFKTR